MDDCDNSGNSAADFFAELLACETFSDFKEYLIDESLLVAAFPEASLERIQVEREFQASYYVMKKFLTAAETKAGKTSSNKNKEAAEQQAVNENNLSSSVMAPISDEAAFKEFICPICLKLIQKCVTTLCGHSYCESCLEDYLLFKEVSQLLFSC